MKATRLLPSDSKYFNEYEDCRDYQESVNNKELSEEECRSLLKKVLTRYADCLLSLDKLEEENKALSSHPSTSYKRYIRALEKKLGYYGISNPVVPLRPGASVKTSSQRLDNIRIVIDVLKETAYTQQPVIIVVSNEEIDTKINKDNRVDIQVFSPSEFNKNYVLGKSMCGIVTDFPLEIDSKKSILEAFRIASASNRNKGMPTFIDTSVEQDKEAIQKYENLIKTNLGEKSDYQDFIDKFKGD